MQMGLKIFVEEKTHKKMRHDLLSKETRMS